MANVHNSKNSRRRKLVVVLDYAPFDVPFSAMVQDEPLQQLIHEGRVLPEKSSSLDRILTRVKLKRKLYSEIDKTVAAAYQFVSKNYKPDDDVILAAYENASSSRPVNAALMLARHLCNGTLPRDPSSGHSDRGSSGTSKPIPVRCVAVMSWRSPLSIAARNDELKSKLPPGVEQVVCCAYFSDNIHSCSTTFDMNGHIISREMCFNDSGYLKDSFIHISKHVIDYQTERIPKWDQRHPIWKRAMSTPLGGAQDVLPSDSVGPAGMYHHELKKYEGIEGNPFYPHRMVWKATRP